MQTYNKINGAIRRHFGKKINKETKLRIHNITAKLNVFLTVHHELTIQNYQRDALNIIYSSNIITLLYMFRLSSTHFQEDIVVHKQHMVTSLSIRVLVSC